MKSLKSTLTITLVLLILISCGNGTSTLSADAEGFAVIEKELKTKFGEHAHYTDLKITYIESIGNIINVTVTDKPESLKMGQWELVQDDWTQKAEVSLEVPEGTKAADFMFQLNEIINLSKLGELVEKSTKQLTTEKKIENPAFHIASVKFPKNGDFSKAEYIVMLKPENGGTTFSYFYTLNGEQKE